VLRLDGARREQLRSVTEEASEDLLQNDVRKAAAQRTPSREAFGQSRHQCPTSRNTMIAMRRR
jgi:hypothetical protein